MKNPLISVIIPIYKVEEYLEKCVKSVQNQTYKNLEIILVDDGSPDNCPAICDRLAENDSRIKVIHKQNCGVSAARNTGIDVSKGRYITFVDSDDYVHRRFIEILYKAIVRHSADISGCRFEYVYSGYLISENVSLGKIKATTLTNYQAFEFFLWDFIQMVVCWNKLYKRELFDEIRFPDKDAEDIYVSVKIIAAAQKVTLSDCPLYYYLQREVSFTHSNDYFRITPYFIEAMEELEEFCKQTITDENARTSIIRNSVVLCEDRILEEYYRCFLNRDFEKMKQRKIIMEGYSKRFLSLGGKYMLKHRLYRIHPALFILARGVFGLSQRLAVVIQKLKGLVWKSNRITN